MPATAFRASIGVKAIIVRDQHLLTVVKRYPDGIVYILPGGSQKHGEPLDAALRRECQEELGTTVTVDRLLFVREYVGANHEHAATDSEVHIVDIMFACRVPDDYTPRMGTEPDSEQVGVQWLPLATLNHYRFYPAALQAYLLREEGVGVYIGDIN